MEKLDKKNISVEKGEGVNGLFPAITQTLKRRSGPAGILNREIASVRKSSRLTEKGRSRSQVQGGYLLFRKI